MIALRRRLGRIARRQVVAFAAVIVLLLAHAANGAETNLEGAQQEVVRSVRSGSWSDPTIWSQGRVPKSGDRVLVGKDHDVLYDVVSDHGNGELHVINRVRNPT